MKKTEIIKKINDIRWNLIDIEDDIEDLLNEIDEDNTTQITIKDLEKFIRKLREENLYTKELEEFIANYIRYDNGDDEQ